MKLEILDNGIKKVWEYDNIKNIVYDDKGDIKGEPNIPNFIPDKFVSKYDITKVTKLSVNLGLNCNYNCLYCSEKNIRNQGHNAKLSDVPQFIKTINSLKLDSLKAVQFFGGEVLLYWKVGEQLIPYFREKFPNAMIWFFTNGSLLTDEIVDFCLKYNVFINVSDDGTANGLRKNETDEEIREKYQRYDRFAEKMGWLFGICSVVTKYNKNIIAQKRFFNLVMPHLKRFDFDNVLRGYKNLSLDTQNEFLEMSRAREMDLDTPSDPNDSGVVLRGLERDLKYHYPSKESNCGIPLGRTLVVDLKGNVFSCEHNSSLQSKIGNLDNLDDIRLTEYKKKECRDCLVYTLCGGICPKMDIVDCRSNFANYLPYFKKAFKDLWGVEINLGNRVIFPILSES